MKHFTLNGDELPLNVPPPHSETKTYSLVFIQHITFILSIRGTHKQWVCYYSDCWWQIYLSAFYSFPMIKPGEEAPAPQPSCSPSPLTHSSRWVVFSSPACRSPAAVPSATCDSSSTWPPGTQPPSPSSPHPPILCRHAPPPLPSENTPQQAWHTCHVSSRSPASNPKWLSRRHAHARNSTFDTHRRISV